MKALTLLSCLGCLLSTLPSYAEQDQQAENQATTQATGSAALLEWYLASPSVGSDASGETSTIENAFPVSGLSLTFGTTSSLGNYKFPVAIEIPVSPSSRQFRLSGTYDPLVIQRPKGESTGLSSTAERKGSLVLSDQLKEPPPGVLHGLNLKAKVGYDWDTREGKPGAFEAILDASSIWLKSLDMNANASLGETRYASTSTASSYSKLNIKVSAGTEVLPKKLHKMVLLSAELSRDHYSGSGFTGIEDVTDKNRHTDYNLKEVLAYTIQEGQKDCHKEKCPVVRISFTEKHVGTRDHDLALGVELGINLTGPYKGSRR